MRKVFKKAVAVAMATTMALGTGVVAPSTAKADDAKATDIALKPWSFYEGAASFRSDKDAWAQRFYTSVSTSEGETLTDWGNPDAVTPEKTLSTTKAATGFTADILTTGWDGDYTDAGVLQGNNPYMLRADMKTVAAKTGHDYTVSFKVKWTNTSKAPEKNVQVGITNAYGEDVFQNVEGAVYKIKVPTGTTAEYSQDFTLWAGETLDVSVAYGCFLQDFKNGLTTEDTSAKGKLEITDFKIVDKGQNPNYVPEPSKPSKPSNPSQPSQPSQPSVTPGNNNGGNNQPAVTKPATKKLTRVAKVKAKNNKAKTVKVTWRKVANAKKYEVKVGNKTYTAKKATLTVKKLKKGKTYKIKVRAKATGFKTGAWSKTVKVKIKK